MRFPILTAALAALCFSAPTLAQDVQVFGGKGTRAASTLVMFGKDVMAGMSVTYGEPGWQDSHEKMLPELKGRLLRLGKDWWTTFTTSVAIDIGGTKIPAGSYLLGLQCDKDGKFSLALLDATKGMQQGAVPFENPQTKQMNWKPDMLAPLTFNQGTAKESVAKMSIELKADQTDPSKGTFTIAWGKHTLTAPMTIQLKK
jgi:hypothetical protein